MLATPSDGCARKRSGESATTVIAEKSRIESYGSFFSKPGLMVCVALASSKV